MRSVIVIINKRIYDMMILSSSAEWYKKWIYMVWFSIGTI